jgi:hypothetical protein
MGLVGDPIRAPFAVTRRTMENFQGSSLNRRSCVGSRRRAGGTLVEIDDETASVMQTNGAEIEFALDRLKPYEGPSADEANGVWPGMEP